MRVAFLILLAAALMPFELLALRSGDQALPLDKLTWLQGGDPKLLPDGSTKKSKIKVVGAEPQLKVVVFLLTRGANTNDTLTMLASTSQDFKSARIAVVTPDPVSDAKALLTPRGDFRNSFAVDRDRELTSRYMDGSLLYPMAFAVDPEGTIIWSGEAVDLPEMLQKYFDGKFDADAQRRISPLLDELQNLLRERNERKMKQTTDRILQLEPGHPGAMRIRLFVLEENGQIDAAWELIDDQIERSPQLLRLYLSGWDLISRNRELAPMIGELAERYSQAFTGDIDSDNLVAWSLLNLFPEEESALVAAAGLLKRIPAALPQGSSSALAASIDNTRALYNYRIGKLAEAVSCSERAERGFIMAGLTAQAEAAANRSAYFRAASKLAAESR